MKTITTQSELNPKDRPLLQIAEWCQRQGDIVVLQSGLILTSDIHSRSVQNCKNIMRQFGFKPGNVVSAAQNLINILLADAEAAISGIAEQQQVTVSLQQQRLRTLIKEALSLRVSDIHIEVRADVARIRFRQHGELYLHAEWQPKLAREIVSVAFNKETDHAITHFNPLVPQNASMPLEVNGTPVRLRLASLPAHGGFDVVLRVLATAEDKIQTLSALGYLPEQILLLERATAMPHGAVIISGPTGSGKTTTVAACMGMVDPHRKIYTIEDPVEKVVANATQIPVNTEKDDRDFASMGKAALRMDPDIIVLGEMRDEDTASVMLRAAITGHLVFSTLHTNSATAIATRLVDMGVSPLLLGDPNVLVCLVCQRLLPILCEKCASPLAESATPNLQYWQKIFDEDIKQLKIRGQNKHCGRCHGLGIQGRSVVAEVVWIDEPGRQFIQQCDTLNWEKYLRANGWRSYREHALDLIKSGKVDPLDAERLIGSMANIVTESQFIYHQ